MTVSRDVALPDIFTVGHSNHDEAVFLALLKKAAIDVVADVRSSPYSRRNPQFNRDILKETLLNSGRRYVFLGDLVGGMPKDSRFYDDQGYVLYGRIAETDGFKRGIERILTGIHTHRIALMCSEENPASCHRRLLIARVLAERGVTTMHLRGDGRIQLDSEIGKGPVQTDLFADSARHWRSTHRLRQ